MFSQSILNSPGAGPLSQTAFGGPFSRRHLFKAAGVSFGGLALANLLRSEAAAGPSAAEKRSVIVLMQSGGPSHLETWDMKPQAPIEYRGEFKGIGTSIPGYQVGEYMPNLAKVCHKLAILRSVFHDQTEHGQAVAYGVYRYKPTQEPDPGNEFPSIGSIVSKELGPRPGGIPAYVATMQALGSSNAAYLGVEHNPFQTFGYPQSPGFQVRNLVLPQDVDQARLDRRRSMLTRFDDFPPRGRRQPARSTAWTNSPSVRLELVSSAAVRDAFDLNKEPAELREATAPELAAANRCCWPAGWSKPGAASSPCRSTANGTRTRTISPAHRKLIPPWDQALATLIEDLDSARLARHHAAR